MGKPLVGKVAVVTGGSRGIGAATAERLATHGAGVAVSHAASAERTARAVREVAGIGDYAATKAAVVGYARSWARDLGPRNLTVNVAQPGAIDTELDPKNGDFAPVLTRLAARGRYGTAEDVAAAVAFQAGPDANSIVGPDANYNAGTTPNVDGGHLT